MAKKKIFLADDHAIIRYGMATLIQSTPGLTVCGEAADARTAFEKVLQSEPHLVVVDISLKDSSGLELVKNLRSARPELKILVVTMHEESLYGELSLRAGAHGYLTKDNAMENIIPAIRQLLDGSMYLSETLAQQIVQRSLMGAARSVECPTETLTAREKEVLSLLGQWKTTREIAQHLGLSHKTVGFYREKLKTKLNVKTANELIQFATSWFQKSGT